jgi:hypothetical protein
MLDHDGTRLRTRFFVAFSFIKSTGFAGDFHAD